MAIDQWLGVLVMPVLFMLLHLAGLILALVYWRRCPAACSLLFTAAILHLVGAVGRLSVPLMVQPAGVPFFSVVMWGLAFINWLGYGLMLMAIFAGRNDPTPLPPRATRRSPEDDDDSYVPPPQSPLSTKGNTGIKVT